MTISSTNRKAGPFAGNDVTVAFPFAFKVFDVADVLVVFTSLLTVESALEIGTDYSVSLNSNQDSNPGGTVTLVSALSTGTKVTLTSAVESQQPVALTNQGGFYPRVINDALDRLTILVQQLAEQVSRSVKIGISSSASPDEMLADISAAAEISQAAAITAAAAALAAEAAADAITLPIPVASGGTGSTSVENARTALDVPSKTGSGASGTWGVSISGTAASATAIADGAVSSAAKIADNIITPTKLTQKLTLGTVATASGVAVDFTGIPAWVKRITVMGSAVSTNGSSLEMIQLGDSGGVEATGYESNTSALTGSALTSNITTGLMINNGTGAGNTIDFVASIVLINPATNTWVFSCNSNFRGVAQIQVSAGAKSLSAPLDRVRVTMFNGTDTFDAGSVNILFEG